MHNIASHNIGLHRVTSYRIVLTQHRMVPPKSSNYTSYLTLLTNRLPISADFELCSRCGSCGAPTLLLLIKLLFSRDVLIICYIALRLVVALVPFSRCAITKKTFRELRMHTRQLQETGWGGACVPSGHCFDGECVTEWRSRLHAIRCSIAIQASTTNAI